MSSAKKPLRSDALILDKTLNGVSLRAASQKSSNRSLLLSVPGHILADIMDLLFEDAPTLRSLAFVNSTCHHLARSCQFSDVVFNYNPQKQGLVHKLLSDTVANQTGPCSIAHYRSLHPACHTTCQSLLGGIRLP